MSKFMQSGSYPSLSSMTCESCNSNCDICSNTTACITCNSGYYLNPDDICIACNLGYYSSLSSMKCESCNSNCRICSNATACITCNPGYYLNPDGSCKSSYPEINYYPSSINMKCESISNQKPPISIAFIFIILGPILFGILRET